MGAAFGKDRARKTSNRPCHCHFHQKNWGLCFQGLKKLHWCIGNGRSSYYSHSDVSSNLICILQLLIQPENFHGWRNIGWWRKWRKPNSGLSSSHLNEGRFLSYWAIIYLQVLKHHIFHCQAMSTKQSATTVSTSWPPLVHTTVSGSGGQLIHWGISKLWALRQATAESAAHRMGLLFNGESDSQSLTLAPSIEPIVSEDKKEELESAKNLVIVNDEFESYIHAGIVQSVKADTLDLDLYWEVSVCLIVWSLNCFKLYSSLINIDYLIYAKLHLTSYQPKHLWCCQDECFHQAKRLAHSTETRSCLSSWKFFKVSSIYCQEQLDFLLHLSNTNKVELKWIPSTGVGDVWEAIERGRIDKLVEILNSAVPTVTTESSDSVFNSFSA